MLVSRVRLLAADIQAPLRVGDALPVLRGQFLTGKDAVLPQTSAGTVALLAVGFTYQSRYPVEAWADWYRKTLNARKDIRLFEVPMIGGMATLGRWFIDRGMRKGTPVELHEQVITVYGGTREWKERLSYSSAHEDDAYLILLDDAGVVRWLHHGVFEQMTADQLQEQLTSLADHHAMAVGHGSSQAGAR